MYGRGASLPRLVLRGRRVVLSSSKSRPFPATFSSRASSLRDHGSVVRAVGKSLRLGLHTTTPVAHKVVQTFHLADIGEGITECEIIKWSVSEGSEVQAFDPLCEVQSDKASVEITSPYDGVVSRLVVAEGAIAKVGSPLCLIETEVESEQVEVAAAAAATATPTTEEVAEEQPCVQEKQRRPHPLDPNPSRPVASPTDVLAAPSVRHFARKNGVEVSLLAPGSGKRGRVEKRDVEQYLEGLSGTPTQAEQPVQEQKDEVILELGRTRYGMWKAMTKSLEIPQFGYTTSLDLTALHALMPTLNALIPAHFQPSPPPPPSYLNAVDPSSLYPSPSQRPPAPASHQYSRLTFLPLLLKTLSKAMVEWPLFRCSLTPSTNTDTHAEANDKPTLTLRPHADIALALSTPTGLYTPTLREVDTRAVYALAGELAHLTSLARRVPCGLGPREMPRAGGTLTVSNVGAVGRGESAVPVLVPGGGVAIVALGRARWVWDVEDEKRERGERRLKMAVSWSGDHRVVEGAELAAFVECWRGWAEHPERLIAESV